MQGERCAPCRKAFVGPRKKATARTCLCGRVFESSAGFLQCGACRHQAAKHPCEDCAVPVDKRAKVCRQCWGKRHAGAAAPQWKGGRAVNRSGYVRVQRPGHHRAHRGYVLEHVLVMEETLGRYLLPGENVHHLNGVRDDNRPENLELWVTTQPAGQRVEDVVAHALAVLQQYAPHALAATPALAQ